MEYTIGNTVYIDGTLIGTIACIIITPLSKEVTHIVIKQLSKSDMKIVPLELIDLHTKKAIVLKGDVAWEDLLNFQAEYYETVKGIEYKLRPKSYLHPLYYSYPEPQIQITEIESSQPESGKDGLNRAMLVFDKNDQRCGMVVNWEKDIKENSTYAVIQLDNNDEEIQIPTRWISHTEEQELHLLVDYRTVMSHNL